MIKILIVDDEERFLESMKKRLEVRGFNVIAVNRGIEAIEAARKNPVDIAILDLKMPGMSGNQLLQILKRETSGIEVIVLTGHGGTAAETQSVEDGADAYLLKPCSLDDILIALASACKRRLVNKGKISREDLDKLIARNNPGGTVLGAIQAMERLIKTTAISDK